MTAATIPSDSTASLWHTVCLASAHFQRAQKMLNDINCNLEVDKDKDSNDVATSAAAVASAEKSLGLYQSCHRRVKKQQQRRHKSERFQSMNSNTKSNDASSTSGAPSPSPSSSDSSPIQMHLVNKKQFDTRISSISKGSGMSNGGITSNSGKAFTINLELRMAQTLRFLALVHATTNSGSASTIRNADDEVHNNLDTAIKCHDMAVSLLVGVYDEEEQENIDHEVELADDQIIDAADAHPEYGYGPQHSDSINTSFNSNGRSNPEDGPEDEYNTNTVHNNRPTTKRESREPEALNDVTRESEVWITGSFSDQEGGEDEDNDSQQLFQEIGNTDRVMLRIQVPNDPKLNQHLHQNTPNSTAITQARFLQPTEDERVRSIAVSLNALAELHAQNGDDRAAMDSYREALEILRAATEEDKEEEEVDIDEYVGEELEGESTRSRGMDAPCSVMTTPQQQEQQNSVVKKQSSKSSSTNAGSGIISPIQSELANTLMNVGNFHLRRDELDAALNAYSTVWALHSGNSLDQDGVQQQEHHDNASSSHLSVVPSTPSSIASAPLPYLTTPQTPATAQKSLSTPNTTGGIPSLSSPFATPNTNAEQISAVAASLSPGALAALTNLGIVHERQNEVNEALSCFSYVHQLRTVQLGQSHIDTLGCLINIGNCYQRLGQFEEGERVYGEAVRGYQQKMVQLNNINCSVHVMVRIRRSLAGALRNQGTCLMKQRRLLEAIDILTEAVRIEEHVTTTRPSISAAMDRQAKESMAQLLGLLGCLYLEGNTDNALLAKKSHDKSAESFQRAIELYEGLYGSNSSHPSVAWAKHNLAMVMQLKSQPRDEMLPPPPPPATPSPRSLKSATPPHKPAANAVAGRNHDDEVDLDDIDSVELDEVLALDEKQDGDDDEDVFMGVDQSSTDELDEFFSREDGPFPRKEEGAAANDNTKDSFEEEVDLDECVEQPNLPQHQSTGEESPNAGNMASRPLSNNHRNFSASMLSDMGDEQEDPQQGYSHSYSDDEEDERVSQLQSAGETLEVARAYVALAEEYLEKDDRASATELFTHAHSIYVAILGDTPSGEVAMVLKGLGDLNAQDDALEAAIELYLEALEMELAVNGTYLPQTLNAAGAACLSKDDFRLAMDFHRKSLSIQKKSGQNKYEMYETLVLIGNVYYSERNNFSNIASPNGVDYSEFIQSGFLGWIANAHDMRGEYMKAKQFYEESLEISLGRKKGDKEAKRETALTLNRLGSLARELGRFDEAMDYHQRALDVQKSGSGKASMATIESCDKPALAETCVLMGMVKAKMGAFKSALNLFEDSLLVLKKALGEDHASTWKTLAQIGSVHFELSHYDKAISILLEAERWQLASGGKHSRDTLETQALIGRVLSRCGKYSEALEKLKGVCERQDKLFVSKHPTIADTISYIGQCFLDQGMATEARKQFTDCYRMRKHFSTVDQMMIAESMVDVIRARNGNPERALAIYNNAMEVYKEYLCDDHVMIGRLCVYGGDSHAEMLNFSKAIERYKQAKQIFHKAFEGECAIDSALVEVSIGKVLLRKCDYDSAKTSFSSALDIYQQILPDGHEKISSTLNQLDRVEQEEALCV